MGVPGFFASLYKKYSNKKFVFSKLDFMVEKNDPNFLNYEYDISSIDELYLDTNCLIHPVCFKVFNENQSLSITNPNKLEEKMIKEVIIYIEKLINYINPSKLVYIAIDGVAPMAKIKHQRLRRFKSVIDNDIKEDIAKKHNVEYFRPWNNSAITPGTEFMEKLTRSIINYCNIKKQNNLLNENKIQYIFSSANTSGEGEHKILQHIKLTSNNNLVRIIYGLDADLLYLAMASEQSKIYLLREITEFQNINSSDEFCFVSIDIMKECVYNTMIENIKYDNLTNYKINFIQDYIFMGFLLGNDFLPALPSVNLSITGKNLSGLEILIRVYQDTFILINENKINSEYEFLISKNPIKISYDFLLELFRALSGEEEIYWKNRYKYKKFIPPCHKNDQYNIELHRLENLMFKIPDLFELGKDNVNFLESKKKYYSHYYNEDYNLIKNSIYDYFQALYWTSYYYFDTCQDYIFFFNYHKLPFISDIFEWMLSNKENIDKIKSFYPKINNNLNLIHPLQQLFMVLPIQSSYLLPFKFKKIMTSIEMEDYFPRKINQDFQLINKYWQALPEIKIIEPYFAWEKIKNLDLTEKEKNRNKFKKPYNIYI